MKAKVQNTQHALFCSLKRHSPQCLPLVDQVLQFFASVSKFACGIVHTYRPLVDQAFSLTCPCLLSAEKPRLSLTMTKSDYNGEAAQMIFCITGELSKIH